MYSTLVFLHVVGILGFLTAHGVAVAIAFKVRGERSVERLRALLDLSSAMRATGIISLLLFLVSGIIAGFMGDWWGQVWIWASLGLLVVIGIAMNVLGSRPLNRIRQLTQPVPAKASARAADPALAPLADDQQIASILAATHPLLLTVIGGGGTVLILWLMMAKPF
ncbi:MAG: hypothetical protein ACM3N4_09505 [Nitrososphaerota archaeon]